MKPKLYCIISCIALFTSYSFSQKKEFNLINYTQENGLPSNESYFVYRDSRNFMWIATDKGVVRYDGNKMENYDLPDNVVFKIREDSKGRIWFFSHTGRLAYFLNGAIYPYKYNENILKTIKTLLITDAYVDNDDNIIINSGLSYNYRISGSGFIEKVGYVKTTLTDTCQINITRIWKNAFFPQIISFAQHNFKYFFISRQNNKEILNYRVPFTSVDYSQYGCTTTNSKDVFLFLGNTIVKLMENGSFIVKNLPSKILCLNAESNGHIWVGMMKSGAMLLDSNLVDVYKATILGNKSISGICHDYEGGIWFSTLEKGVYLLKNVHINHFSGDSSLVQQVYRIYNANDSILLYANTQGLYSLSNAGIFLLQSHKNATISDLFMDNKENIYMAGSMSLDAPIDIKVKKNYDTFLILSTSEIGQLYKKKFVWNQGGYLMELDFTEFPKRRFFSKRDFVPAKTLIFRPGIVFSDSNNQVWAGTIDNLYKFIPTLDTLIPFNESSLLFKKGITCMRQMGNGIYTIGIRFGGIALMENSNIIGNITEGDGLLNNSVKYLLPLKNQLWAATAKGVSVIQFQSYHPLKYTIRNIGKNEGFYNLIINQLIQYQGNILAATSNGIYIIEKPQEFLTKIPKPIPFYINSVSYYKGDTSGTNSITVPYNRNRVVIKYSALCFSSPEDIKYYYRVSNNDTAWQIINNTELILENLSPGRYKLEIKAAIPNLQRYSEIQKFQIIVNNLWWQNGWFRLAAIIFLTGSGYYFYKRHINKIRKNERQKAAIKTKMIEMEQTVLRSQMNPHFIFNSLASIQQLIITGNTIETNEYLVKFARLIRKTLELSTRPFIKIEEEREYLEEYLTLEQYRIPGQFEFRITIDASIDTDKTEIPNMMLQPIVENCIRHGIKHLEDKKGIIIITMHQKDNSIYCSITDNGIGRKNQALENEDSYAAHKSYGINIVRKRLEILHSSRQEEELIKIIDFQNEDGSAKGTQVIMLLPFKISNP